MLKPTTTNRPTFQFIILFLTFSFMGIAQTYKPFSIRKNIELKGNMLVVGNSILGQDNLPFNDVSKDNQDISMQYIDIDGISSTFSSSSADIVIPNQPDGSTTTCYRVAYAGLYWSAILQSGDRSSINQVKFKVPNSSSYNDITGEIVYDAIVDPIPSFSGEPANTPYVCYADVTNLLIGLTNLEGTYTVANVTSSQGLNFSTGLAAGWTLVVIYENPNLETKSFTTFDGFSHIYDSHFEEIPISGFNTPPSGSIDIQMAYAALDGDRSKRATKLEIDGKEVTSSSRPANKFFGSVIENSDGVSHPRNPFSLNTLGYDTGFLEIENAEPEYIKNGDTTSGFTLQVARGQADPVFTFLNSFAVDVIAPDIVLTKIVTDDTGTEIDGADVVLGQRLFYEITYQSVGNDNVVDFTLKDVLPDNIFFDPATDIDLSNAGGATLQSYDASTRTLIFNIPNSSVQIGDPKFVIRLATQVVSYCYDLSQACSNEITNQAYASYSGVINNALVVDEGSFATTECFGVPGTTNFLVDITNCNFQRDQVLCGASVDLIAADGYDSYSWSTNPSGIPVIGTGQTFTATSLGTYYVMNTTLSTCTSINEEITVIPYGSTVTNPIIPFADEVNTCPNDGKSLPDIYLCGVNATRTINTGIADAVSIIWEKLDETSCSDVGIDNCANESSSCVWNQIATGPNYVSDTSGQYRIVINYPGGCFSIYYFNVYANLLAPTISAKDIICDTQGQVTAGGIPTGYEYSLDPMGPYQSSNVFAISSPGFYTIYSRQIGVSSNPCIFETPSIYVRQRNVSITPNVSQPLCFGDKGTISVAVNDGLPQYNFSISLGGILVSNSGLTNQSDYTFANLNKGLYTIDVSTDDGCVLSSDIEIIEPANLEANLALTKPLTCDDGEITIYPTGGTPPYLYYVNSTTDFQNTPTIPVTASGVFDIRVVDSNNCFALASITVDQIPAPVFNISKTDVLCYGDNSGQIQFNVTSANGYTIAYSIDNGLSYVANPIFSNLVSGTYQTIIRYSINGNECFIAPTDVDINQPAAALTATAEVTELAGCGSNGEGRISINNAQGGVAPYEYSFDNQTTWASTNEAYLLPGTYTLYIRDTNGCVFQMPDTTIDPEPVAPSVNISNPEFNCDGTANFQVTVTNSGSGTFNYTYLINGIENTNTADRTTFLNIAPSSYTISITYELQSAITSCTKQSDFPIVIDSGNAFSAGILSATNETCVGADDGTITITAQNFDTTNGFQYSLDGTTWITENTSPHTISGLASGNYNVQIRYDAIEMGCDFSFNQSIAPANPLGVNASASPITCNDGAVVTAAATGGVPAYSYDLLDATGTTVVNSFPLNGILTNVSAGNYLVRVTDVNNCTATTILNLIDPLPPTGTIINADYCFDSSNQAALEVSASGGQSPYMYSINGGAFQSNPRFTGLIPNTYTIIVRDAYGCEFALPAETIESQVTISGSLTKELDCTSSPDGVISGTISNGYPDSSSNYQYAVSIDGLPFTNLGTTGTTFTYTALTSGTYQFQVIDDNACESLSEIITVSPKVLPTATLNTVSPLCHGDANGSVQIIPASGVSPYEFSFNGSGFTSTSLYAGLSAGVNYSYEVRDAKNCVFSSTVTLTDPTILEATASATTFSCSASNGKQAAVVTIALPTTGTAPYTYSFDGGTNFSSSNTLTVNDDGSNQTISYAVKDANDCETLPQDITIDALNPPTDLDLVASTITCNNPTSTVNITTINGVGTLQFETLAPSPIIFSKQTSPTFTGLTAGTYVFRVTDTSGCYYTESINIPPVTEIAVTGRIANNVSCNGGNDGAIGFRINRFTTTYSYSFNGAPIITGENNPRLLFTGLTAGIQTITVTDETTGCTETTTVTVTQPANALSVTADPPTRVHCNEYNSQITINASNGTPSYTYAAVITGSPAPAPGAYTNSNVISVDTNTGSDLVWDVYVKDANACTEFTTVTIILDAEPTVTVPTISPDQCSVASGFTFTATGTGITPLAYSINGGASYQASSTFTVNTPGTYTVTIRDGNGCTLDSPTSVEIFEPLTTSATLTKDLTCSVPLDANIDITVTGGNAPYTYEVSYNSGAYVATGGSPYPASIAGTYQFRITDANSCSQETNAIIVTTAVTPDVTVDPILLQSILCNGEESAEIDVTVDNTLGLAPFVINVNNDTTGRDYGTQTSGLDAGDYTITVTDAKGCTDTDTITISEPDPIVIDYTVTPITCGVGGVSLGEIVINTVTGGTPNYTYHVTGINGYDVELLNQTGSTQVFEVVDFGLYEVIITDTNGCTLIDQNILVASPPDDLDIVIDSTVNCATGGEADVSIGTATTITGTGPFYFAIYTGPGMVWDGILGGSVIWHLGVGSPVSTTFVDLIPGVTYTFIVYDDDSKCYYFETATTPIATSSTLSITGLTAENITCRGNADGNVSFDITSIYGVDTVVDYEIRDSQSLVSTGITGSEIIPANGTFAVLNAGLLDFGNYIVVIEETTGPNAGCGVATVPFNITESAIDLGITASSTRNQNCNELGVISAITTNGTAPYEYQFLLETAPAPIATDAGWIASNTFEGAAEDYTVYVKDAYGCIKEVDVTIDLDPLPTINSVAQQCFDGTPFNITLVQGNGLAIPPFTYSIGGAYQSSNTFSISTAGPYSLSIKDGNGCIVSTTYDVTSPLLLDSNMTQDLTCDVDASISLTPSGGSGVYSTYEWSNDGGLNYTVIGGTTFTTNLSGTYQFRVTDSQTCQAISASIIVTPNTTPILTETHVDVTCNGGSDGSIVVTPANGIAPYEFSIDGGTTFQVSNVFNGLSFAGSPYSVVVRDAKRCESLASSVTITEPSALIVNASSPGFLCDVSNIKQGATVTIDVPSTGTPPYSYSFDGVNFSSSRTLTVFDDGTDQTINYYVKDTNSCTESGSLILEGLNTPTDLTFNAITTVTCAVPTSNVELIATNGDGVLSYDIIAPISVGPQPSNIFTGLAPETYTFRVTDENGCFYTESYTVEPVTNITVRGRVANDVSCNGGNDGIVGFRVGSFSTTYSYVFDSDPAVLGQTDLVILKSGLSAGNHTITVTDEVTGCSDTLPLTVNEPTNALSIDSAIGTNVHCNNDNAIITVTASGGTPNYEYAAVTSGSTPAPSDYVSNNVLSVDTNSGSNLAWDIYVKDASCITPTFTTVTIINDPLPAVAIPAIASNQCNITGDRYEFAITSSSGVGVLEYSIGTGYQTSGTFTNLLPGIYDVTVKDENGCTATSPTSIIINDALDVTPEITALPSCAVAGDGVIRLEGSGGTGAYSYTISPNTGASIAGNIISGLSSNVLYTITLDDGVCTRNTNITLAAPTPVTFTTIPTAISCNGGSDGTITVNLPITNDNPIYTYSLDGGVTTQTSNVFSGLTAGTYNITVTSGRNCILTQAETVVEPNIITVPAPSVVEYACTNDTNFTNFATITVDGVSGGSSNYSIYEFMKGGTVVQATASNVYTETDLLGGTYTINVYDDNGCQGTTTAIIQPFIGIDTLNVVIDNAITCTDDEDITVLVTFTGGSPTLNYTVEDVDGTNIGLVYSDSNTTGSFTNLPIGDYAITVLNPDTGCSLQTVHYVNDPNTFDVTIDKVVDVTCFSDSDGSIDVTFIDRIPMPTNESGSFTYTIDDALGNPVTSGTATNAGPITISGFSSGTYSITASLTNTPFCTIRKNFTITAPTEALSISESHTQITCVSGNNDGSISATALGGWPGDYEFQLELTSGAIITAYSNISNFSGLIAGDYIVNVRDSRGCVASTNVLLENPQPIIADISATLSPVLCFGDTSSSIEVTNVFGGQGSNYTFTLNMISPVNSSSGPQTSGIFTGLGAGTYNVLIQDGYSCEFTTTDVVITEPSPVEVLLVQTTSETCTSGSSMTLNATGGTGRYEYSDDASFSTIIGSFVTGTNIIIFPATRSVTYKYYVRDANGCKSRASNEITIDPLPELQVNIDATNAFINCTGDTNGVIKANAQGGLGNYTYILQNSSGTDITPAPTQSSPGVFTELPAGIYQVRVTSGIDCEETSEQVEITEPTFALQTSFNTTDVTCAGGENGSIEIVATGGTGTIKYAISPQLNQFFESPIFEDLTAGTYQAVVQDELGCFVLIDFVIDEPTEVMLSMVPNSIVPEICSGDLDGSFSVDISGGTLPYSYSLDDIDGTYTTSGLTQTQFDFENLSGGDHIVYVRDGAGCESEWNITFPESVLLDPQVSIEYGCSTNLSTNTVTVSVDSSITNLSDVDYSLNGSPFQSSNVFIDVPSGIDHTITVRHTNGCEKLSPGFDIDLIEPLDVIIDDGELNQIVASVSGGVPPYEYSVNGEDYGGEEKYYIYSSGDYTVNVTDANGCVSAVTQYFEYIDVCIPNYFTPNGDGTIDNWGPGCTTQYKDLSVIVFDRYGREIVRLRVNEKWDGNYKGKALPSGDYWYILKLNDPKDNREFIGHFTLYR